MSEKYFVVDMMASGKRGTLYTGLTSNLVGRVWQHKNHVSKDSFTDRYDGTNLVWFEPHGGAETALIREKQITEWRRAWKVELIEENNPGWDDFSPTLI